MTIKRNLLFVGLLGLVAILVIALLHTILFLHQVRTELGKQKLEADLVLGRANTTIADASSKIKELEANIAAEIKARQATVELYTRLLASYSSKGSGQLSTQYKDKIIIVTKDGVKELTSLPFAFQDFRLNANGDAITKSFSYSLKQNFEIQLVETKTKANIINHYAELYELDPTGHRIGKLELTKFDVIRSPTETNKARFHLWNPRLDIGINNVLSSTLKYTFTPIIGFSTSSYGVSTHDISWRFIRFGLDFTGLSLSPVVFNIAHDHIPLMDNLWIGPAIGTDFNTNRINLSLGLSAAL